MESHNERVNDANAEGSSVQAHSAVSVAILSGTGGSPQSVVKSVVLGAAVLLPLIAVTSTEAYAERMDGGADVGSDSVGDGGFDWGGDMGDQGDCLDCQVDKVDKADYSDATDEFDNPADNPGDSTGGDCGSCGDCGGCGGCGGCGCCDYGPGEDDDE